MRLFVDTSALIALEDRSDNLYPEARRFFETLTAADRLVTSNYVVDETITRLRYTIGVEAALGFAQAIFKSRLYSILYIDEESERQALEVLKRYKDKKLSFTDCTTIALMPLHRLDGIFAFDEDFRQAGLRVVP